MKDFKYGDGHIKTGKWLQQNIPSDGCWVLEDSLDLFDERIQCEMCDVTVADLLNMDEIAIYPRSGWMKIRKNIPNEAVRYSLIVSLEVEDGINLYTEIQNMIDTKVIAEI